MSSNVATTAGASIAAIFGTITTTAVSINAGVNAVGNFAQAANIKSSAWLDEVREDTEDLSLMRQGLRDQRIAAKVANEAHSIAMSIQDPGVKAIYDTTLANLQKMREEKAKAASKQK